MMLVERDEHGRIHRPTSSEHDYKEEIPDYISEMRFTDETWQLNARAIITKPLNARAIITNPVIGLTTTGCSTPNWISYKRRRLVCEYCGCISGKENGTCEHCGAPLVEEE